MNQLEEYLKFSAGLSTKALTPELQALAEGREMEGLAQPAPAPRTASAAQPITDDDREELRKWSLEHGYRICFRLIDNWLQEQEDEAKQASTDDPLGRQSEISKMWAYVAMQKRARIAMEALIQAEIAKLK